MDEPLRTAAELWRIPDLGDDLRLVGGLAVRLHAGGTGRVTRDVDVVAMTVPAREALLGSLRSAGWRAASSGAWWRASTPGRPLIDIAQHPVVSPRTFDEVPLRRVILAALGLDAAFIEDTAAHADIERRVSDGAARARQAMRAGELADLTLEVTGAAPPPASFAALDVFLWDLEKRGL